MTTSATYRTADTIAAEATPHGRGGMSVIRISGDSAQRIAASLFDKELPPAGAFRYGAVKSSAGKLIDDCVISCFAKPHSYTGEDVVEISVHGSPIIVADLLEEIYATGARPAEPGEFTMRAFLNDQMDLTEAEAVADLIDAGSREALQQAQRQLKGGIGQAANDIALTVTKLLVSLELELDFTEDDVELSSATDKRQLLEEARSGVAKMLQGYEKSRRLREGAKVVIKGAPNVGKSSLFNALLGEERAIVTATPGTTRDVIRASCLIHGIRFELFDTAGLRDTTDAIEDEGIRRALAAAADADLTIAVTTADIQGDAITDDDASEIINVLNKVDLEDLSDFKGIRISVKQDRGLEDLRSELFDCIAGTENLHSGSVSRERHFKALTRCDEALMLAGQALNEGQPAEMIAEDLRQALTALDELTGKNNLGELLNTIFADFCIGK